jgi:heptosyltransferase-2
LIIQTAYVGDVLLVTPLIKASHDHFPDAIIDLVVIPAAANIVETNPALHAVIVYDKRKSQKGWRGFIRLARHLRRSRYDMVLVPHRSLRSAALAWYSRAAIRAGFTTSSGSFLFTHRIVYHQNRHEVERNLALLEAAGIAPGWVSPEIFPSEEDRAVVDRLFTRLAAADRPLAAVAPGSMWATKRWPVQSYREMAARALAAGWSLIWVGGESDRALCAEASHGLTGSWVNCAGELTLRQSAELIRRADILVTNDSAPLHLASAVDTPAVAIFGPTVPEFGFSPSSRGSVVVQKSLPCRPCSIHGGKKCPIGTHECMTSIPPEWVLTEMTRIVVRKSENERNH